MNGAGNGDPFMIPISIGFKTHPGKRRESNQDSYAVLRHADLGGTRDALLVVADGMGGVKGGEIASRIVAETITESVQSLSDSLDGTALLTEAIHVANAQVLAKNHADSRSEMQRMGTTCVAAILEGSSLVVGNVGDSRAYLLHQGRLFQITQDHSQVWKQVQSGQMSREEARSSKYRNVVTRMVGLTDPVEPDLFPITLKEGDVLLLCSDGLSSEVPDSHIARLLAESTSPQEASERLVSAALEAGGSDNITVVVLHYGKVVARPIRETAPTEIVEEDENTTDPDGKWREELRAVSRKEREEAPSVASRASTPPRTHTGLLLLLLLVGSISGHAWTWWFYIPKIQPKTPPPPLNNPAPVVKEPRTSLPLFYGAVVERTKEKLRPDFLQWDKTNVPIVATEEGTVCRVGAKGELEPMPGRPTLPDLKPKQALPMPSMVYDVSGNRYQPNVSTQSLFKFDTAGTRIRYDIGKGKVVAPTALLVSPSGEILFLSRQHLYSISAFETEQTPKPIQTKPTPTTQRNSESQRSQ